MTYRFASEADSELLARWNFQLIEDEKADNPMTIGQLVNRMQGWLESKEYQAVIFASENQEIAYALFSETEEELHLRQFFVARTSRRQGHGRSAFEILRSEIWPSDRRLTVDVLAHNSAAYGFWRTCNYHPHSIRMCQGVHRPNHAFD